MSRVPNLVGEVFEVHYAVQFLYLYGAEVSQTCYQFQVDLLQRQGKLRMFKPAVKVYSRVTLNIVLNG